MTLHLTPQPTPPGHDRATGNLHTRPMQFSIDGWRLMATSLDAAKREAELMGEVVDGVEVEH